MTITTLLITCIIFLALGWTDPHSPYCSDYHGSSRKCRYSHDRDNIPRFKDRGSPWNRPRSQQIAEIIGLILPAAAIGFTLYLLNDAYGFGSTRLPAPQATLMAMIAKGVIQQELPMVLVMIGIVFGLMVHLMKVPVLPFAISLYLPLSLNSAIMIGGVVNLITEYFTQDNKSLQRGILICSGLVAGNACMGVLVALFTVLKFIPVSKPGWLNDWFSLGFFVLLSLWIGFTALRRKREV